MSPKLTGPMLAASVAIAIVAHPASAQIRCQWIDQTASLPTIEHSIADWETRTSARLSPQVRSTLDGDVCKAVRDIADQSGATPQEIDTASRGPIMAYLDDMLAGSVQFPSLAARLEAQFLLGASGQLPEQRRTALLSFSFTRAVDRMLIGAVPWEPPVGRLISQYGAFAYQGSRAGRAVCQGNIVINSSAGAVVQC